MRKRLPFLLPVLLLALSLLLAACGGPPYQFHGTAYDPVIPAPALVGVQAGDVPFDLRDLPEKVKLVFFGYTFCPDVCPLDMARNAEVADILEEQGQDVRLAFITVDPARDTAQVVSEFAQNIHPKAVGLTGSEEQIKTAVNAYRAYYKLHEPEAGDDYYLVDHSAFTYLMLPGTGFADFYKHAAPADEVAQSVSCYLQATSAQN